MSKVKQPGFGGFNLKLLKGRQCIDEYIMFFYTEILMIFSMRETSVVIQKSIFQVNLHTYLYYKINIIF